MPKRQMHSYFYYCFIYKSEVMESTQVPSMVDCVKKMWYIHSMEYYIPIKKNKITSFVVTWMQLEAIIYVN